MFTQYFGQYLLSKGYLTLEKLRVGLECQKGTRVKMGVLAVNAGYMKADDADKVNEAQKGLDKRFGELAVEMGYLKEEQIEELLFTQKFEHLMLGQALVDKGYMTIQEFEKAVNEYRKDYNILDKEFEALQKDDVGEIVNKFIKFEGSKNEKALKDYVSLFTRNLIRFIDTGATITEVTKLDKYEGKWTARQDIKGQINLSTFIEAEEASFIKFGSKYAKDELNTCDNVVKTSVGEFLNLHNGILLVNMYNEGVDLVKTPQDVYSNILIYDVYKICLELSFGKINILIKEE